jgi:hypothetical protein
VAIAGLAASASPAAAAVTIGQTATPIGCSPNFDMLQQNLTSGDKYLFPATDGIANWTITSWSTQANANPGSLELKVWSPQAGTTYQAFAHDGPRALTPNSLNTFQTNISGVRANSILGLHTVDNNVGCSFAGAPGDQRYVLNSDLADGQQASFSSTAPGRLDISARAEPTNTFSVTGTNRNKKKGNARVSFLLPNPGSLTATGTGVQTASAEGHASATLPVAGPLTLEFRATGKKKTKLLTKGKIKLAPTVTYTPTGGAPKSLALSLTLKLKKKK